MVHPRNLIPAHRLRAAQPAKKVKKPRAKGPKATPTKALVDRIKGGGQ